MGVKDEIFTHKNSKKKDSEMSLELKEGGRFAEIKTKSFHESNSSKSVNNTDDKRKDKGGVGDR